MADPKYTEWLENDKLILLQGWARDGLSDEQIAHNMGIHVRTLYMWKKKPECEQIFHAIKNGKEVVDYIVENALMKNAMSGNVAAQIFWLTNRKPDKWKNRREQEINTEALTAAENVLVKIKQVATGIKEEDDG